MGCDPHHLMAGGGRSRSFWTLEELTPSDDGGGTWRLGLGGGDAVGPPPPWLLPELPLVTHPPSPAHVLCSRSRGRWQQR